MLFLFSSDESVDYERDNDDVNRPFFSFFAEHIVQHISDWIEIKDEKQYGDEKQHPHPRLHFER